MKLGIKKGATSQLVQVFIQDSSSAVGAGLAGLTSGSAGLVCYRARSDDGNAGGTQLTLSAGTRGTWSSGGFVEKDATNMPGIYELGLDNAGLASGADRVVYMLKGATNMAPLAFEIELVAYDPQDSVSLGLTAVVPSSNVKKNTAKSGFMFVMTDSTTHTPKTALSVTATRSIDGGAFAACTNAVTEVATGTYVINLSAADMNGDHIMLRFAAAGADDLNIEIITQP